MKNLFALLTTLLFLSLSGGVSAATVYINDGDTFFYDNSNTYIPVGALSVIDPYYSFLVSVNDPDAFDITVGSSPIDLNVVVSTALDGGGQILAWPNILLLSPQILPAGDTHTMSIQGSALLGGYVAYTVWLDTSDQNVMNYLATQPNQQLMLSSIVPVNAVPIPAAVWLFGSGLLGLVGMARNKKTA